jgi:hypothetical protein
MTDCFPDPFIIEDAGLAGGVRWWKVCHYFRYLSSKGTITVPTGFRTDLASVPQAVINIISRDGQWMRPAIIHDFLYSRASNGHFEVTRKTADLLFKEAMWNEGVGWQREAIFAAVRAFGWRSYKKR